MKENFFSDSNIFRSSIANSLIRNPDSAAQEILMRLEDAFKLVPDTKSEALKNRLRDYSNYFRSATWELFFFESLNKKVNGLTYEAPIDGKLKNADFGWKNGDSIFFLEAICRSIDREARQVQIHQDELYEYLLESLALFDRYISIIITSTSSNSPDREAALNAIHHAYEKIDDNKFGRYALQQGYDIGNGWTIEIEFSQKLEQNLDFTAALLHPLKVRPISYESYRESLATKFTKFENARNSINIVAIAIDGDFPISYFGAVEILFGRPAIKYSENLEVKSWTLSDESFFYPGKKAFENISGVIFGSGEVPGFSSFIDPLFVVNPNSKIEILNTDFPINCRYLRFNEPHFQKKISEGPWETLSFW